MWHFCFKRLIIISIVVCHLVFFSCLLLMTKTNLTLYNHIFMCELGRRGENENAQVSGIRDLYHIFSRFLQYMYSLYGPQFRNL